MNAVHLKESVRMKAADFGFDLCCFTQPAIAGRQAESLSAWVKQGMHGDMVWMAEPVRMQRRADPSLMLENVRTVITLAMRYSPPEHDLSHAVSAAERGVISAYAYGEDYHDIMKKRLKQLAAELDALLGVHDQRVFVDTAPVLEHALAEQAGLGWQGKHSLSIHRELGSWFLLGEIFTTAEIEPDRPATHHCGSCTACIDICPTQAIVAPYIVDARRCISYLTIEFDGFIDPALRPKMGNRIYGCDDCQQACPWNRHVQKPLYDYLNPDGENVLPELASLLRLDAEAFRRRFRKSPIRRTRRRGLLRNVCIAMGNSGQKAFVSDLIRVLQDEEPLIRGHAAWALAKLADAELSAEVLAALRQAGQKENDAQVVIEIDATIAAIEDLK